MNTTSIFFNHSFDKKKLKAFIYWVLKMFGEKEALTTVEELKRMGFYNATKAGLSIGLHDLKTPLKKTFLISSAEITMNKTDQEFQGAELTATERSQRIIDTWHRTSEDLRKQVVDYFSTYDQLNSVYMMALSGARGNFSQVRQLIGMRGLMADPQGQIISFPIRSNLREGLTLTEYFISCSGARKGLVDTALRTADTGYLTRRLVDISHHIVVKKVTCYTSRGIALKTLRTSQKVLLPLKDRLVGRVLGENIYDETGVYKSEGLAYARAKLLHKQRRTFCVAKSKCKGEAFAISGVAFEADKTKPSFEETTQIWPTVSKQSSDNKIENKQLIAKKNQEISPDLAFKISLITEARAGGASVFVNGLQRQSLCTDYALAGVDLVDSQEKKDVWNTPSVLVRSPLTCTYTHEVCQLCYGWSMSQGSLVSLGEAVGVIAGQSIGEPGTQLTMRTFHTGGVFSGDLLREIRAPHSGKISFPKALQGLLIRSSQGKIAFLIKVSGELLIESDDTEAELMQNNQSQGFFVRAETKHRPRKDEAFASMCVQKPRFCKSKALTPTPPFSMQNTQSKEDNTHKSTKLLLEPSTILFVRQGEKVKNNQILAELAITSEEGNQPIQSRQTLFSERKGRVVQWKSMLSKIHREKGTAKKKSQGFGESQEIPYPSRLQLGKVKVAMTETYSKKKPRPMLAKPKFLQPPVDVRAYLGAAESKPSFFGAPSSLYSILDTVTPHKQVSFIESLPSAAAHVQHYEEMWGSVKNYTLKQIVLSKKHGLGAIEPPKALELGLLSVIAIQIGASEKTCTNGMTHSKSKLEQAFQLKYTFFNKVECTSKPKSYVKKLGQSKNNRFSDLSIHFTGLQDLNTIAEEGDLVDENYTQI